MLSTDVIFRRLDRLGATMSCIVFLSLAALLFSVSSACVPKVPVVESPVAPLLSRNELNGRGPVGITVAPQAIQETDSRGWFWWQIKPVTTADIIFAPIRYGYVTAMFPLTFPLCYENMTHHETYIRQVTEEMDVQMVLRDAMVREMRQSFSPAFAFSMGGRGSTFDGEVTRAKAQSVLELHGVKVYLDNWQDKDKSENKRRQGNTLIVESRWLLRDRDGSREDIRVHEVSARSYYIESRDIPYELFLLIDEHAKEVVKRLAGA